MSRGHAEREDTQEPALDRLFADLAYALRRLRTRATGGLQLSDEVATRLRADRGAPELTQLPSLRYRLRRDGHTRELVVECFAMYHGIASQLGVRIEPEVMHAAYAMVRGSMAQLSSASARIQALAMAAWSLALAGVPVHVLTASDAMSQQLAELLKPIARPGQLRVAAVTARDDAPGRRGLYRADIVCVNAREVGHDYLRDRYAVGPRVRTLPGLIERLSAAPGSRKDPLLPGLHCALVADADSLMIDDAQIPLMLAADVQQPETRLVHEQALEFARALLRGTHFSLNADGARLTGEGRGRLARLVTSLGGVWRADQGREGLIEAALDALHVLARDRDYRVERDAVQFPPQDPDAGEDAAAARAVRQRMVEIKEGCRLSGRREVLARLPFPRFLRRYVRLAGVCEDAAGLAGDFRMLYRLRVVNVSKAMHQDVNVRILRDGEARDAALVQAVQSAAHEGAMPVVAVRTPKHAQTVVAVLTDAGLEPVIASGDASTVPAAGQTPVVLYPTHHSLDAQTWATSATHLIVAELHDAARHVQQLYRTLTPASCTMLLALDDDALATALGGLLPALKLRYRWSEELAAGDARRLYAYAQQNVEKAYSLTRLELITRDQQLSDVLAFSGQRD